MNLPDLLAHLTALADRVSHEDRFVIFEAIRRLQHGGSYVIHAKADSSVTADGTVGMARGAKSAT